MKRVVEFAIFVGIAAGAHLAIAAYAPPRNGAQSAGNEGAAVMSLQGATGTVSEMVAQWDAPPEVTAEPDRPASPEPDAVTPDVPSRPVDMAAPERAPKVSGLAVPRMERPPELSTTPPPPPQSAEASDKDERLADIRPAARPETLTRAAPKPQRREPQESPSAARTSAPQKASGQGGGANAGAAQRQQAATLSASQRQSLTAQWGAQVRRKIERNKRYPRAARGASGTVRVRITVGRDGSLRGASVAGSSGHPALDEAALRAVRAARYFPAAPRGLGKPTYTFALPMRFSG